MSQATTTQKMNKKQPDNSIIDKNPNDLLKLGQSLPGVAVDQLNPTPIGEEHYYEKKLTLKVRYRVLLLSFIYLFIYLFI